MTDWWDGLRQAYSVASAYQAGFTLTVPAAGVLDQNVMSVGVETGEARVWTVALNRMRYSAGVLLADRPPDNQVGDVSGAPPALPAVNPGFISARLVWGTAGATERALVDWRQPGTTLQLQASFIRVGLVVPTAQQGTITFSGTISPGPRSTPHIGTSPTLTPALVGLAASPGPNNGYFFPIADRAVAYRVVTLSPTLIAQGALLLSQTDAAGVTVVVDNYQGTVGSTPSENAAWTPLVPSAQFVGMVNTTVGAVRAGVQFLLDLG